MDQLLGSSITYRIAVGPQQGRKVFTLQTLPACDEPFDDGVGKVAGFSLTRFHGVFAPNSKHRALVTAAKRGRGGQRAAMGDAEEPTPAERRASMTWAQRLKRVFNIDIETCAACGGAVRIIACIEDPPVIEKILSHLDTKGVAAEASWRPPCRAPPQTRLFDRAGLPNDDHPGLRRQRRGNGGGWPEGRRHGGTSSPVDLRSVGFGRWNAGRRQFAAQIDD